jgi:hypothetical protein
MQLVNSLQSASRLPLQLIGLAEASTGEMASVTTKITAAAAAAVTETTSRFTIVIDALSERLMERNT